MCLYSYAVEEAFKKVVVFISYYNTISGAEVHAFVKTIAVANGVIFANPVYYRSYSETLKNALDNLDYGAFWIKLLVFSLMTIQPKMRTALCIFGTSCAYALWTGTAISSCFS
ncbi:MULTISPECIES: NADPH-dependent FMN reductase [unclassified Bartonella]|uniref:NADPH-dependent FMN reductase n=1 Tax=unclassified Bartonella TaxID=2645622 RepID=UPI0035D128F2